MPLMELARACGYQVAPIGAPVKSRCTVVAPAEPNTAENELHESGSNCASTLISTSLWLRAAQIAAAYLNTSNRWVPRVVPGLPPTGATDVVSLKPSFGPSAFTIVMVVAAETDSEANSEPMPRTCLINCSLFTPRFPLAYRPGDRLEARLPRG